MSRVFYIPQVVHEPFWMYYNRVSAVIEYRCTHGTVNGLTGWDFFNAIYYGVNRETFEILQSNCNGELQHMHWRDAMPFFTWFARVQYFESHAYSRDLSHPCMNVNDFPHASNANAHDLDDNHSPHVDSQNSLHCEFSKSCPCRNYIDDDDYDYDYDSCYAKDDNQSSDENDVENGEVLNLEVVPLSPTSLPLSESDSHPIDDCPLNIENDLVHLGCHNSIEDVIECEAPNLVVLDDSAIYNEVDGCEFG
ncbi:uncharacterized protein [Spinacia oleracea]|uniref:Uncharacterized protein isoform X1 n=1 Tax=Spinacia oleracea TaxID=3562 RepID=A0ABM3QVQ8_SPIOL|nr:uncharacterized protein LOC110804527 isoform X1 [Spinacia oleracea]XP_056687445.1 uncharacterized protein LOC110804527 isoform X1 [Spinacia oleracea]